MIRWFNNTVEAVVLIRDVQAVCRKPWTLDLGPRTSDLNKHYKPTI